MTEEDAHPTRENEGQDLQKVQDDRENRARIERQLETLLSSILTPEAKARLTNVRLINYEKYLQVSQALIMLQKQGRITEKVSEEQVKHLLTQLTPKKREMTIRRK